MRIINTSTKQLVKTFDPHGERSRYAILSHTWGDEDDEVSFQDFQAGRKRATAGWEKIVQCCELARADGLGYVWVDTCCIDKTSSAELSQNIQSMFAYYQQAAVCYVFLSDYTSRPEHRVERRGASLEGALKGLRWFRRGWTLQELLAPQTVRFYDREYQYVGSLDDHRLLAEVSRETGIDERCLTSGYSQLSSACVGQRMSWLARRTTSVPEDMAYCMLGIFNVNMPLLYGEGLKRAFLRLQEHIIANSSDESIFAWEPTVVVEIAGINLDLGYPRGILAEHPREFRNCGGLSSRQSTQWRRRDHSFAFEPRPPYSLSNVGLRLPVLAPYEPQRRAIVEVTLDCLMQRALVRPEDAMFEDVVIFLHGQNVNGRLIWYRTQRPPASTTISRIERLMKSTLELPFATYHTIDVARSTFELIPGAEAVPQAIQQTMMQSSSFAVDLAALTWAMFIFCVAELALTPFMDLSEFDGQLSKSAPIIVWSLLTICFSLARWKLWFPIALLVADFHVLSYGGVFPGGYWWLRAGFATAFACVFGYHLGAQ